MRLREIVKESLVRALVGTTVRLAVRNLTTVGKALAGRIGTNACHRETLKLLSEWAKWAPTAKDTEVPGILMFRTMQALRNHTPDSDAESSGVFVMPVHFDMNGTGDTPNTDSVPDQPVPAEDSPQ